MKADDFAHIEDPDVPALRVLLGAEARDLLEAIVGAGEGELKSVRISQIRYSPGKSVVVRYTADVAWSGRRPTRETLVAASGISVPEGVPLLASDDVEVAVWSYPNDPFLPGLRTAASTEPARRLLAQVGVDAPTARLRLRAYRPGRRAVVEVTTPKARLYVKVVRPERVADLQQKHTALSAAVPVPHSHGWNREHGLVVLQAMPGKPLRKALESGTRRVPGADQFLGLLDLLPKVGDGVPIVAGPDARVAQHAMLLKRVAPELADRIDALVTQVDGLSEEDLVPVHGDFHSSQLLVKGPDVVGLIDVDTAGMGYRSNDLAVLLAHLSAVGLSTAARRSIDRYGAGLISEFDRVADPATLRLKVAAALVGFATGPFRVNLPRWRAQTERRIALAERWAASAHRL
jgi:tRNA A-37 threonylcarbamoyl transferase component Bud32